jgi:hypothetical protein
VADSRPDAALETLATGWVKSLGRVFRRAAIFGVEGTTVRVVAVHGIGYHTIGRALSLLDKTPVRWAIEAASPIIGAGADDG